MIVDYSRRYCIIGAGAAGLTAAKNLKQLGIPFDVLEREDDIGGNWYYGKPNSSIYRSVHMISSKNFSAFLDFPMPEAAPTYLGHAQAWQYLKAYAGHFGVIPHIQFGRSVERMEPAGRDEGWDVCLDGGERRRYRGVVIANGHLWNPKFPDYPGRFDGVMVHSSRYKTPDILREKRVLVVGAGNSGCDIAVESSQNAAKTFHSMRRGYHFWPKYLLGLPSDLVYELPMVFRIPMFLRRFFGGILLRINSAGNPSKYGLPKPAQKLYGEHFIINSTLLYHLGHGDIHPKPDVKEFRGKTVVFVDGSEAEIDVIVCATGFNLTAFPFVDSRHLQLGAEGPGLYLNMFHPASDEIFVVGLFQTSTGNWPIMDYQARLLARYLHALDHDAKRAAWFRKLKASPNPDMSGGIKYPGTYRYAIEVEHWAYRGRLKKLIAKLEPKGHGRMRPDPAGEARKAPLLAEANVAP